MPKTKNAKTAAKNSGFLTPSQQWLALTLLGLLVIIAIFYFGVGGDTVGQSG